MQDTNHSENQRKRTFFIRCSVIIILVFLVMTFIDYQEGDTVEYLINIAVIIVLLAGLIAINRFNKDIFIYRIVHFVFSLGLFYMVSLGAGEETVLYWAFVIPLVFFFFFGKYEGLIWAIAFSVCLGVIILMPQLFHGHAYSDVTLSRFFIILSLIIIICFGLESSRHAFSKLLVQKNRELLQEKQQLERALKDIKTLKGLIPICSNCKNIRNDEGFWEQVEIYVRNRSDADFSHSICPECLKTLYPEYDTDIEEK